MSRRATSVGKGVTQYLVLVGDIGNVQVAILWPDDNLFLAVLGSSVEPLITRRWVTLCMAFQARRLVERDGQLLVHWRTDIDYHRRIYNAHTSDRKETEHIRGSIFFFFKLYKRTSNKKKGANRSARLERKKGGGEEWSQPFPRGRERLSSLA